MLDSVICVNFREEIPEGFEVIDVTSRSDSIFRGLSPFILGPVTLCDGRVSKNVENAWQFSKVYEGQVDENGDPDILWRIWSNRGFRMERAVRYPKGKGVEPLYSYYCGEKLGIVEARKKIYLPLYSKKALESEAFGVLRNKVERGDKIAIKDFDVFRHDILGKTFEELVGDPNKPLGHGFVLYNLISNLVKGECE